MRKSSQHTTTTISSKLYELRYPVGLIIVLCLAIYFRFLQLGSLPPGLSDAEATNAQSALTIIHGTSSWTSLIHQGLAQAIISFVQAISIKLNGTTAFALRLPVALIGVLGVSMTYLWVNSWFGRKTALIASLLMAITPWTVGLSRIAIATSGTIVVVPTVLWLATLAIRTKRLGWQLAAGIALGLCTASVSASWLLAGLTIAIIPAQILRRKLNKSVLKALGIVTGVSLLIGLPLAGIKYMHTSLPLRHGEIVSFSSAASRVSQTLGMFNVHGDSDFHYNIGGTPQLNLFVGLMFLVGVLVCIMKLNRARHRVLFVLLGTLLIPAMLSTSGTPNSLEALVAAPVVFAIAAIGTVYMLDIWYSTFPINSAARTLGTAPIVLLLIMSVYQGHKQYFVAWAKSPEIYTTYNENATALAKYLIQTKFNGTRYVLATGTDSATINYLTTNKVHFTQINDAQIASLPPASAPVEITFVTPREGDTIWELKKHYPKAQLSQHYSEFNDNNQLFAVYQTKP